MEEEEERILNEKAVVEGTPSNNGSDNNANNNKMSGSRRGNNDDDDEGDSCIDDGQDVVTQEGSNPEYDDDDDDDNDDLIDSSAPIIERKGSSLKALFEAGAEKSRSESKLSFLDGGDDKGYFRQRLWTYVFKNVRRSMDELYYLCEFESSVTKCGDSITFIDSCLKDFQYLYDNIQSQKAYVESPKDKYKCKPIAWEVRRTTPSPDIRALLSSAFERMEHDNNHYYYNNQTLSRSSSIGGGEDGNGLRADGASRATTSASEQDNKSPESNLSNNDNTSNAPSVSMATSSDATKTQTNEPAYKSAWTKRPTLIVDAVDTSAPPSSIRPSKMTPPRSLHDKLTSYERRKPSPQEARLKQEEKQRNAKINREQEEKKRLARLRVAANKVRTAAEKKAKDIKQQENKIFEKLKRAEDIHEAHVRMIQKKAENENSKVEEISFINTITSEDANREVEVAKMNIQKRLEDSEARRLEIKKKHQSKSLEKAAERDKAAERRKALELANEIKTEERSKKSVAVEVRRLEKLEEVRRAARKNFVDSDLPLEVNVNENVNSNVSVETAPASEGEKDKSQSPGGPPSTKAATKATGGRSKSKQSKLRKAQKLKAIMEVSNEDPFVELRQVLARPDVTEDRISKVGCFSHAFPYHLSQPFLTLLLDMNQSTLLDMRQSIGKITHLTNIELFYM